MGRSNSFLCFTTRNCNKVFLNSHPLISNLSPPFGFALKLFICVNYLYEKNDGSSMLSLVSPNEWGKNGPFKKFIAGVRLLADHTWMEL